MKNFIAREVIRKPKEFSAFAKGAASPVVKEGMEIVEDYLEISRKRVNNVWALSNLQIHLLQDIIANEKIVERYKDLLHEREAPKDEMLTEETARVNDEIHFIESRIYAHELVIGGIKCVADGLAWRLLDYDRALLYVLASKQSGGLIKDNEGLVTELHVWAESADSTKHRSIINCITNFLRTGDVTVIGDDGTIEFKEVKQSKQRGARITRQRERLYETVTFLNTGIGVVDGTSVRVASIETPIHNYHNQMRQLILRAGGSGFASEAIGDFLIFEAVDFDKVNDITKALAEMESKHKSIKQRWKASKDLIAPYPGINFIGFSRNVGPLSIYPFEPKICAQLMFGKVYLSAKLNISLVMKLFINCGWKITQSIGDQLANIEDNLPSFDTPVFTVQKGPLTLAIPFAMVGRIAVECLSPRTLVDAAEGILAVGPEKRTFATFPNFVHEKEQWK